VRNLTRLSLTQLRSAMPAIKAIMESNLGVWREAMPTMLFPENLNSLLNLRLRSIGMERASSARNDTTLDGLHSASLHY
jgi:hypothetical protein